MQGSLSFKCNSTYMYCCFRSRGATRQATNHRSPWCLQVAQGLDQGGCASLQESTQVLRWLGGPASAARACFGRLCLLPGSGADCVLGSPEGHHAVTYHWAAVNCDTAASVMHNFCSLAQRQPSPLECPYPTAINMTQRHNRSLTHELAGSLLCKLACIVRESDCQPKMGHQGCRDAAAMHNTLLPCASC